MECELDKITVHYETLGEGRPIVFFHGNPLDHTEMIYEMEPIFENRKGWMRIYPDLPGSGQTPGADWITTEDDMLEVVEDFVEKIIPGRRFVVAGTSAGGYYARGLVYRLAERMDGLFLNVPVIIAERSKRVVPTHVTLVKDKAILDAAKLENIDLFEKYATVQNRAVLDYTRILHATVVDEKFQAKDTGSFSFELDRLPRPFTAPTLFIMGRQDHSTGYRNAWNLIEDYPRATFAVLDRAGHLVRAEQSELWTSLVNEWLDRVEEWVGIQSS